MSVVSTRLPKILGVIFVDLTILCYFLVILTARCCGKKFCASCLDRWIKTRPVPTCPYCRATNNGERPFEHVIERGMKSNIESLHIKCYYNKRGCKWTGEIRNLKEHLLSDEGCNFALVWCPNHCRNECGGFTQCLRKNLFDQRKHNCNREK